MAYQKEVFFSPTRRQRFGSKRIWEMVVTLGLLFVKLNSKGQKEIRHLPEVDGIDTGGFHRLYWPLRMARESEEGPRLSLCINKGLKNLFAGGIG